MIFRCGSLQRGDERKMSVIAILTDHRLIQCNIDFPLFIFIFFRCAVLYYNEAHRSYDKMTVGEHADEHVYLLEWIWAYAG